MTRGARNDEGGDPALAWSRLVGCELDSGVAARPAPPGRRRHTRYGVGPGVTVNGRADAPAPNDPVGLWRERERRGIGRRRIE